MQVQKRDGRLEDLNIDKLHKVPMYAVEGITGVSAREVEINRKFNFSEKSKQKIFKKHLLKVRLIHPR